MPRHPRAIQPGPDQESVWDYPRPPRLERILKRIVIRFSEETVADTTAAYRVLETSHPPTYYIPPSDIRMECLRPAEGSSLCEWKGAARYLYVVFGDRIAQQAGWSYPRPTPPFEAIRDYVAFYPALMDECTVAGEVVSSQPDGFYGGWVTSDIVGPMKGMPGSFRW